jgi:hypothetical protein
MLKCSIGESDYILCLTQAVTLTPDIAQHPLSLDTTGVTMLHSSSTRVKTVTTKRATSMLLSVPSPSQVDKDLSTPHISNGADLPHGLSWASHAHSQLRGSSPARII